MYKSMGLHGIVRGRRVRTTIPEPLGNQAQDLVQRDFTATHPNQITKAITRGDVEVLWKTKVEEITPTEVRYRDEAGAEKVMANGTTLIFAGGELPTAFLKSCGVQIDTKFGAPR